MMNFDGRVNNGSKTNATIMNEGKSPLNCLNVHSNKQGYCINAISIDEKTNEIPTIEKLIKGMNPEDLNFYFDEKKCDEIRAGSSNADYLIYREKFILP